MRNTITQLQQRAMHKRKELEGIGRTRWDADDKAKREAAENWQDLCKALRKAFDGLPLAGERTCHVIAEDGEYNTVHLCSIPDCIQERSTHGALHSFKQDAGRFKEFNGKPSNTGVLRDALEILETCSETIALLVFIDNSVQPVKAEEQSHE